MNKIDELSIKTIRTIAPEMVQTANSGHPGAPMGLAPVAHVLWTKILNFSSKNSKWLNRDRVILSNGHGCALQYVMLHLTGYKLTLKDLKNFRQLNSKTPGHPENHVTDGIEVTTGPLGQGLANGVGMAIAQEHLKAKFNNKDFPKVIDNTVYVICGDGCLMEGVTSEAASLAGHLKLSNLVVLYDDNNITIDGKTDITFTENVGKRFESYNWEVLEVKDGNSDLNSIEKAIKQAKQSDKPTLIKIKTKIGFGSEKEGTSAAHGAPLGEDGIKKLKKKFGFDADKSFDIKKEVYDFYKTIVDKNNKKEEDWNAMLKKYEEKNPKLAKELKVFSNYTKPTKEDLLKLLPTFSPKDKAIGSRKQSGVILNALASKYPNLVGGSADLAGSNCTSIKGEVFFQPDSYIGRTINFGVREHGMAAIANGMRAYAGFIPYVSTFLVFLGYMFGAARLSALSEFQVIYILTHDSIGLGEDGPTHQATSMISLVRSTPNFYLMRPADGNEVAGSYLFAMTKDTAPTAIALSRQNLPQLEGSDKEKVLQGAYVLTQTDAKNDPDCILISTGSEVGICVEAKKILEKAGKNVRVVSMPCMKLFDEQKLSYRESVLCGKDGKSVPVISCEAAVANGWFKYSHFNIGLKTFGSSGPYDKVYEHFGITDKNVAEKAQKVMDALKKKGVPSLASVLDF